MLSKTKWKCSNRVNINDLTDSKMFWKTVKLCFVENVKTSSNIVQTKKKQLIKKDIKLKAAGQ